MDVSKLSVNMEKERDDTIRVINEGRPIVPFLSSLHGGCGLLDCIDQEKDVIASGEQGTVYNFHALSDLMGKKYAVKETKDTLRSAYFKIVKAPEGEEREIIAPNSPMSIDYLENFPEYQGLIPVIRVLNAPHTSFSYGEYILIPDKNNKFSPGCLTTTERKIHRLDYNAVVTIPPGSYLCYDETFSEYVISLLVSKLYTQKLCINFIETLAFYGCPRPEKSSMNLYTIMQLIDGTLAKLIKKVHLIYTDLDGLYIQLLAAIGAYQNAYMIVHGDLHTNNIFVEKINESTMWGEHKVSEYDVFSYSVGGTNVYFPASKYIIKIGDWGLACKYSPRMVCNLNTMYTGYDQGDEEGPWLPNWFEPSYDMLFATNAIRFISSSPFIDRALAAMLKLNPDATPEQITKEKAKYINTSNHRPYIREGGQGAEFKSITDLNVMPSYILRDKNVMREYLTPPPKNVSVLQLGVV
jgi:hypothetical protein